MKKGRKQIQTITDPLLDPYFITKDDYSFTIKEKCQSNPEHRNSKGKSTEYEKSHYYYPKFEQALQKIAVLKSDNKDYDSLEEYIQSYLKISNQIKTYTDGIKSQV